MAEIKSITKNWNGEELRETFVHKDKRFRVITGLRNGRSIDAVKLLGNSGWEFLLSKHDIDTSKMNKNVSYVSDEVARNKYAKDLGSLLKVAVVRLFED